MRDGILYEKMTAPNESAFEESMPDRGETPKERAIALLDLIHTIAQRVGASVVQVGALRFDGPGESGAARTETLYLR